jgi:hypothetical protein
VTGSAGGRWSGYERSQHERSRAAILTEAAAEPPLVLRERWPEVSDLLLALTH